MQQMIAEYNSIFVDTLGSLGCYPVINKPTRVVNEIESCIDHIQYIYKQFIHWNEPLYYAAQARNRGGAFGPFASPEIFKTLYCNFDI